MDMFFSESSYEEMIQALFCRFPSFQKVGAGAYKPGIANMEFADQLMGHPHRNYKIVHVAGTNGKGSVSNMLASVLASAGNKVGLYTSPHILDFRERIRVISQLPENLSCPEETSATNVNGEGNAKTEVRLIPKEDVWTFVNQWKDTFDHLDMSFFEITTLMALDWFAKENVDFVVLETGLGGRLDSTNIVSPILSVITNIGLDHCDMLGETLPEIAFEKAGIIKPGVPVVVGESHPEIDPVFERKVLYTNISEPKFMGSRSAVMALLTFADKVLPSMWGDHSGLLASMDLQGEYQSKNLRTVMAALDVLAALGLLAPRLSSVDRLSDSIVKEALIHTASRTDFHGRWEKISDNPYMICDIGHNEHGLKYNFAQLERMKAEGKCTHLIIVYGSVADKDLDAVLPLMPASAVYIFTQAQGKRALPASKIYDSYCAAFLNTSSEGSRAQIDCQENVYVEDTVSSAVEKAKEIAADLVASDDKAIPLIYIGGSTYVVSEGVKNV